MAKLAGKDAPLVQDSSANDNDDQNKIAALNAKVKELTEELNAAKNEVSQL